MRLRLRIVLGILSVVLLAAVSACGGGSDPKSTASSPSNPITRLGTPGASVTETTVACDKFRELAEKLIAAQSKMYAGSGAKDALDQLVTELDGLKDGAPDDVKTAIDDLATLFKDAQDAIAGGTEADRAKLQEIGQRLASSDAGQKITAYVISKCTS